MCSGRARADDLHHAHHGAGVGGALDVDDLVVVPHREIDRLAQLLVQRLHVRQRLLAHADARLHQAAQLEQPDPEPVGAGLDAVDQPVVDHDGQDAVRGGRMELGFGGELLQVDGGGVLAERGEQPHHALDHLYGGFGFFLGHCRVFSRVCGRFYIMKSARDNREIRGVESII